MSSKTPAQLMETLVALREYQGTYYRSAGSVFIMGQDPVEKELTEEAARIALPYLRDAAIVQQLLASDDPRYHGLGLSVWSDGLREAGRITDFYVPEPLAVTPAIKPWHAMLPRIRVLTETSPYEHEAIKALLCFREENQEFIRDLIPRAKGAWRVYHLIPGTIVQNMYERPKFDPLFNVQLLRLLNDTDLATRRDALQFIHWMPNTAEMFWVHFDATVTQRVRDLENSSHPAERMEATGAIKAIRELKPRLIAYDKTMNTTRWYPEWAASE